MLPEINTIVYATTLGKNTRPVFRHAVKLARTYNARIIMVHALEPVSEFGHAIIEHYLPKEALEEIHEQGMTRVRETMQQRVQSFRDEELKDLPDTDQLTVDLVVEEDNPVELVLRTAKAEQADLVVIGSHSHHGMFGQKLLGDTAQQISLHSKVPVLLVPNDHS
ncbi:universal stress protein [Oceanospirillum sediminis]|uniref:Universal stress protein n=1 Tax=Oceanospirillum sediminis TaxID=2760088 RepID=A0A839IWG0_9GAMM|nr:universal stress protein [Oceanospirillum sediminis]MBB1488789.1 universal stress protein [Oceanospirillum sediminis]